MIAFVREPIAARFYDMRYRVDRGQHEIERNRMLTALALGYVPEGPPDYGLDRVRLVARGDDDGDGRVVDRVHVTQVGLVASQAGEARERH